MEAVFHFNPPSPGGFAATLSRLRERDAPAFRYGFFDTAVTL